MSVELLSSFKECVITTRQKLKLNDRGCDDVEVVERKSRKRVEAKI